MKTLTLKITHVSPSCWGVAEKVAKKFLEEYPDHMHFQNGVVYTYPGNVYPPFYVYRTKTSVVVRGLSNDT